MTSVVQFPMMFLSGTFFVIDQMPPALQTVARFLPLTYLSDALRQVMVNGTAFSPLWSASRSWSAGRSSASGSRRYFSGSDAGGHAGSECLPALLVDDLVGGPPAAGAGAAGRVRRIGRIAEREQELAVLPGRVAQEVLASACW